MQVTGDDHWPRPRALEAAESLLRGDSLSLFSLRRIGKSSYMAAVRCIAEADFHTAFEPAVEAADVIDILREEGLLHFDSDPRLIRFADGLVVAWWKGRPKGQA